MPESRRRKPKPQKHASGAKIKVKGGRKYLRMRDESGNWVWRKLPESNKE